MTVDKASIVVVVGQRVYSGLYGGRMGIVYRIHGEQAPQTVRYGLGGVMAMGGSAHFDIVFDNGSISKMLPESIMRGVQWEIHDRVADSVEIAQALSNAEQTEARQVSEKEAADARRAAERAKHLADNPHLTPVKHGGGVEAAKNIRIELKRAFGKFKFRVTSDYNSVRISWVDGPSSEAVDAIAKKYQKGNFNGMNDSYEFNPDATFADVFGGAQYVFTSRDETVEGLRKAWAAAGRDPAEVTDNWSTDAYRTMDDNLRYWIRDAWSKADLR